MSHESAAHVAQPGDVGASQAESELGPYKGPTVRDLVQHGKCKAFYHRKPIGKWWLNGILWGFSLW